MHKLIIVVGLFALISNTLTATPPAPISVDTKTELAGIKLGQNADEIDKKSVLQTDYNVNRIRLPNGLGDAFVNRLVIKPSEGGQYGNVLIEKINVYEIDNVVYSISVLLGKPDARKQTYVSPPVVDQTVDRDTTDLKEKCEILLEALILKYGTPTTSQSDRCWTGKDVTLLFNPNENLVTINSASALQKALDQTAADYKAKQQKRQEAAKALLHNL